LAALAPCGTTTSPLCSASALTTFSGAGAREPNRLETGAA